MDKTEAKKSIKEFSEKLTTIFTGEEGKKFTFILGVADGVEAEQAFIMFKGNPTDLSQLAEEITRKLLDSLYQELLFDKGTPANS